MRRELLRLQKTSFFESTSSSRGGIYYKCFLKIATKFGGDSLPILQQYPLLREENPSVFKKQVF
jgi:hypothetical protein